MPTSTPPGSITTLDDVLEVLHAATRLGVPLWVDGGWGVDALLGTETRTHGDLDLALTTRDAAIFEAALRMLGYNRCDEESATGWNYLMAKPNGAVVDLHLIDLDEAGSGVLAPPEFGNIYPASSLRGKGQIGRVVVKCIAVEDAVAFRDSYRGDEGDRADVHALCSRFGLPIPEQYR